MKKGLFILLLSSLFLLFTQCRSSSSITEAMNSWKGKTKAELYLSWGPAHRITDDAQDGEILIYEYDVNQGQKPGTSTVNEDGSTSYTNPQQLGYTRTRMFYVNPEKIIYHTLWSGW